MTTPDTINQDLNGTTNGTPNWWDYVLGRHDLVAQQLVNDPNRGPYNNTSAPANLQAAVGDIDGNSGTFNHLDHTVLAAESVSWRYWDSLGNHLDLPTIMMTWVEFAIATDKAAYQEALAAAGEVHSAADGAIDVEYAEVPDRLALALAARQRALEARRQITQPPQQLQSGGAVSATVQAKEG